jgi:hypothetical protein
MMSMALTLGWCLGLAAGAIITPLGWWLGRLIGELAAQQRQRDRK